jgi:hypothetical protein
VVELTPLSTSWRRASPAAKRREKSEGMRTMPSISPARMRASASAMLALQTGAR